MGKRRVTHAGREEACVGCCLLDNAEEEVEVGHAKRRDASLVANKKKERQRERYIYYF